MGHGHSHYTHRTGNCDGITPKRKGISTIPNYPVESRIKWVKRASMWCRTYFTYNEQSRVYSQHQEWSVLKPEAERSA